MCVMSVNMCVMSVNMCVNMCGDEMADIVI